MYEKVYQAWIHMADDEWGNELMREIAKEYFANPVYNNGTPVEADKRPLVVRVHEHAGWSLSFAMIDGEMRCVSSANDAAEFGDKVNAFRKAVYHAKWENVADIRRPSKAQQQHEAEVNDGRPNRPPLR
jgi:hypothetical protein